HQPPGWRRRAVRVLQEWRMAHQGNEQLRQQLSRYDHNVPQHAGPAELESERHAGSQLVRIRRVGQRQPVDGRNGCRRPGDSATITSTGPNYVYATSDLTNLFNRYIDIWSPNTGANDITRATRSIIWLDNDYIVVYDRATSLHAGLFKRFNLCLVNDPAITGNVAIETMDSGQQLFV